MKIIHCADLHIDCKTKFSAEKREIIRNELLQGFVDMVDFAENNKVSAILLCGDIFDDKKPLKRSLKVVQDVILKHPDIQFFHIWGNHDENVKIFEKSPENYICFGASFSKVDFGDVAVGGVSFKRAFDENFYDSIDFEKSNFNILMMHAPVSADKYSEPVNLKKIGAKNVDYLALGHIHKRDENTLGKRGHWAFCGCMRAKSFGDLGEQGFVLLDINGKNLTKTFVPFSNFKFDIVEVDITKTQSMREVLWQVEKQTASFGGKDILRVILVGTRGEDLIIDCGMIEHTFKNKFFHLEVTDRSRVLFDLKKYASEKLSLKAEFVNNVMADENLTDEEKQQICLVGIEVLKGEEVHI